MSCSFLKKTEISCIVVLMFEIAYYCVKSVITQSFWKLVNIIWVMLSFRVFSFNVAFHTSYEQETEKLLVDMLLFKVFSYRMNLKRMRSLCIEIRWYLLATHDALYGSSYPLSK